MNKREYELYMFDPGIYPFMLWVYIGGTDCGIQEHFDASRKFDNASVKTISVPYGGFKHKEFKHGSYNGYIIWFDNRNSMEVKNICHESAYIITKVSELIGEKFRNSEHLSYIAGWIADCCWMVKQKKANNFKI